MKLHSEIPEFNGATTWLNGETTKHELIGDKPTLVHFWSMSCYLCKEAIPTINAFREQWQDKLNVIAVHTPRCEDDLNISHVRSLAQQLHITHPIFIDHEMNVSDAFENDYIPAYYLFDDEGKLRHYQTGESSLKLLQKRIERFVHKRS